MSDTNEIDQASTAVWYFVGAVFILVVPNMLFSDLVWWARIGLVALGFGVMIAGFAHWRRELTENRRRPDRRDPEDAPGSGPTAPPTAR